jgi:hypothetical protein
MSTSLRRFVVVVLGSTGLACLLGICLDLITANLAVEYFSVHHPRIVPTGNPWALALVWRVAASWWFGAISGVIVASINHWREYPLESMRILKWTFIACIVIWLMMIGILLAILAVTTRIPLDERPATFEHDRRLIAVAMAHQFEYVLGAVALLVIAVMTWRSNYQLQT